jgi:MFS family permease
MVLAVLFLISAAGSAGAWNWYALLFFRFLGGVAAGAAPSSARWILLNECAYAIGDHWLDQPSNYLIKQLLTCLF